MDLVIGLTALGILIMFSGVFSGVEAAYISLTSIKVKRLLKLKRRNAQLVKDLKDDSHRLIITLLIGNNLVNIGASAIATVIAVDLFGATGVGIATGIMTFLVLIFGEIIPKSKAIQHSEWICLRSAPFLKVIKTLLYPLIILFDYITRKLMGRMGTSKPLITEEELKTFIEIGEETGTIEKDEKEMIHNIFKLNDLEVREVMTPRINMNVVDGNLTLKKAIKQITESRHTRIPLYIESPDKIVKVLNIRDTIKYIRDNKLTVRLKDLAHDPLVVPETKLVDELLKEMQKKIMHLAIVVDEYGVVQGLVTIEDILEEIVGEIYDETDLINKNVVKIDARTARVKGETSIEELNKKFKMRLAIDNGYDTISGYVLKHAGRIPEQGEQMQLPNLNVVVERVDENRLAQLKITKK